MLCIFATDAGFLHGGSAIDLKNRVFGRRGVCFTKTLSSKFSYKKTGCRAVLLQTLHPVLEYFGLA
jgi:hypothetical protein